MHEDSEGRNQDEIFEEMFATIHKLQQNSLWIKIRTPLLYDELMLTLDSAEFFLHRLAMGEAMEEIDRARELIANRK